MGWLRVVANGLLLAVYRDDFVSYPLDAVDSVVYYALRMEPCNWGEKGSSHLIIP